MIDKVTKEREPLSIMVPVHELQNHLHLATEGLNPRVVFREDIDKMRTERDQIRGEALVSVHAWLKEVLTR